GCSSDSEVAAVVDIRRVDRVRYRAVRRGPVAALVPEADDVALAGSLEDVIPVDRSLPRLHIDIRNDEVGSVGRKRSRPEKRAIVAIEYEDTARLADGHNNIALLIAL